MKGSLPRLTSATGAATTIGIDKDLGLRPDQSLELYREIEIAVDSRTAYCLLLLLLLLLLGDEVCWFG